MGGADANVGKLSAEIACLRKDVRHLTSLVREVQGAQEALPKIISAQRNDGKWRSIFRMQLGALVRAHYVASRPEMAVDGGIRARRFRLRSQHEEDGLVLALLDRAGVGSRRFIEIGSGGSGGNSAVLAYDLGWSGLMIEASKRGASVARELFRHNPGVVVLQKFAAADNINSLIKQAGFVGEVDLLSLDVDSIDYWLFDALDVKKIVQPRLIVAEYNAHFGPERRVTLPNTAKPEDAPKPYFGASLAALTAVAERKGYRLVLCEDYGVNAFFLRNDLAPDIPGLQPGQAYRPMRRRLGGDEDEPHVEDVYALADAARLPILEV